MSKKIKVLYFSSLRESLDLSEEVIILNSETETIEKLKTDNIEISNGINTLKNQILYKKENEI